MPRIDIDGKWVTFPDNMSKEEIESSINQIQGNSKEGNLYEDVASFINKGIERSPAGKVASMVKGSPLIPETTSKLKQESISAIPAVTGTAASLVPFAGPALAPIAAGGGEYLREKLSNEKVSPTNIGLQAGLNAIPLLTNGITAGLKGISNWAAKKSIKLPESIIKKLPFMGQSEDEIAQVLVDNNIPAGDPKKMLIKTKEALKKTGQELGDALDSVDAKVAGGKTKLTGNEVADAIDNKIAELKGSYGYKEREFNDLQEIADRFRKDYGKKKIPFKDLNQRITQISENVKNYGKENFGSQAIMREGRGAVKGALDSRLQELQLRLEELGLPEKDIINTAKKNYSSLSTIEDALEGSTAKKSAERASRTLTSVPFLAGGATTGALTYMNTHDPFLSATAGLMGGLGMSGINKYGPAATSNIANQLSKIDYNSPVGRYMASRLLESLSQGDANGK